MVTAHCTRYTVRSLGHQFYTHMYMHARMRAHTHTHAGHCFVSGKIKSTLFTQFEKATPHSVFNNSYTLNSHSLNSCKYHCSYLALKDKNEKGERDGRRLKHTKPLMN